VPGSVLSQLGRAMNLEGAAGLAVKRLSREGLAWLPTAGNVCTLLAFGIAVHLNLYLTGACGFDSVGGRDLSSLATLRHTSRHPNPAALPRALCPRLHADGEPEPLLLLSPLLLLLSQDPLLLRHLGERQRYLPPVLAFSAYLAIGSAIQVCVRACVRACVLVMLKGAGLEGGCCRALTG
jgi:hypothetical protein